MSQTTPKVDSPTELAAPIKVPGTAQGAQKTAQGAQKTAQDAKKGGILTRERLARLIKFGLVGVSGVLVNLVIFELLHRVFALPFTASNAAGVVVSIFTNFLLNDRWTWGDRAKGNTLQAWAARVGKYYISAAVAAAVQLGVAWAANRYVFVGVYFEPATFFGADSGFFGSNEGPINLGPTLAVLSGIVVGMGINFLAGHLWAFRDAEVSQ